MARQIAAPVCGLHGAEPLLQLLGFGISPQGFELAIETNGTIIAARRHRLDLRQCEGRGELSFMQGE
jgi:hypothetical protein